MARSNNNNKLKAFVRFDGSGRIVPSSLIVQAFKPKVGNYQEIDAKECCNYTTTTTTTLAPTTTTSTTVAPTTTTTTTVALIPLTFTVCCGEAEETLYATSSPVVPGVYLYENAAGTIPAVLSGNVVIGEIDCPFEENIGISTNESGLVLSITNPINCA
jgi:hypothetical protein